MPKLPGLTIINNEQGIPVSISVDCLTNRPLSDYLLDCLQRYQPNRQADIDKDALMQRLSEMEKKIQFDRLVKELQGLALSRQAEEQDDTSVV